jgi:hydroxymethylpyrimidine/phosphomethylpyrimidine kinase
MIPRVLSIAGTDPTGGAGIHADLKSISANGGYGMAVVASLVAQNTRGVRSIHMPPLSFLREQLDSVSDDVEIDAVKIGMLFTSGVIAEVRDWLQHNRLPVVVLDPVMVATSGDRLLSSDSEEALRGLLPLVDLVTPNLVELAVLANEPLVSTWPEALAQARRVSAAGSVIVLVKGGHLTGVESPDALVDATGNLLGAGREIIVVPGERIRTSHTHGTGCSLSSAIATLRVRYGDWETALVRAKRWLTESLRHANALTVGHGNGPIHHFATLWQDAEVATSITADWWHRITDIRLAIDELEFVRQLGDGTLEKDAFSFYVAQDALYLREFSYLLTRASELSATIEEQEFWASAANDCLLREMSLHRDWLAEVVTDPKPTSTTTAYLNHLEETSATGNYGTLIAALLPCFWLYRHVGENLHTQNHHLHPYAIWLETYADPAFAAATERAIGFVEQAALHGGEHEQKMMWQAFQVSAEHERAFFEMWHRTPHVCS